MSSKFYFGFALHFALGTGMLSFLLITVLPRLTKYPTITEIFRVVIIVELLATSFCLVHSLRRGLDLKKRGL